MPATRDLSVFSPEALVRPGGAPRADAWTARAWPARIRAVAGVAWLGWIAVVYLRYWLGYLR
jgi:hypothetical protein